MIVTKNNRKLEKIMAFLSLIVFSAGLIYSIYFIAIWQIDSNKTSKQIIALEKTVKKSKIDFEKLKKINPDTKGWLQVIGTDINYPFVQSADNQFYLSHSFDKTNNQAGWIFMDYRNNANIFDQNTIIYAHGRVDGTMFGTMKNVLNYKWYSQSANHIIKLDTEKKETKWKVFSIYSITTTDDYIKTTFANTVEYMTFLDLITNRSIYKFKVDVGKNDKILTLSTCYNKTEKIVLHAKLILNE